MKIGRNDLCWCRSGKKYKNCHQLFDDKIKEFKQKGCEIPERKIIKNPVQIEGIRESGKRNIEILDYISDKITAGISTEEIDRLIDKKTRELNGIPATLGYKGYEKGVCVSVNNEVCHGIPSEKVFLKEGDIVNIDVSTIYNGYFSDSSRMFCVGTVSQEAKRLVDTVKKSVDTGLKKVKPWKCLGDMGQAINDYIKGNGYSVVREIGGHGVGLEFHEEPYVSYVSRSGEEMLMVPGMIFTIEPMVNAGKADVIISKEDGWTVYTKDGSLSAQWEIMVLVTEEGYEVLAY